MELRCWAQKVFAMEVERLVQLTYPGENHSLIDNTKTDIKLVVCSAQKAAFAETLAFALGQETSRTIQDHQLAKCDKWK